MRKKILVFALMIILNSIVGCSNSLDETEVPPDDYGLEVVTYEQVMKKIDDEERFLLYVGRDTCYYCQEFIPSMTKALEECPIDIPVYYLYTQRYKTAIDNGEKNAEEEWAQKKQSLGITGIPALILFQDGVNVDKISSQLGDGYSELTKEEQLAIQEENANQIKQWFMDNGL